MKNLRIILTVLTIFINVFSMKAQVGIGTIVPNGALDITSTIDGLLIPRIALTITTSALPLTLPTVSELVYNSATVADVTPGYYYWNGTIWVRLATGATTDWSVIGNTGIIDGTNYIGTAAGTNVDVAFRRNNLAAGKIGATSTSFGVGALNVGAATNSSAFGTNALTLNTGANNVAFGNGTLAANVGGIQNTGIGNAALAVNTGSASTAIGFEALKANVGGNNGTAVGFQALSKNIGASNNTAFGFQALTNNTTGGPNTAIGYQSSNANISGSNNTSVGYTALAGNTVGTDNVAIGHNALARNTGSRNTVIGFESEFGSAAAFSNTTAIGWHALFNNSVNDNTAIGYQALNNNTSGSGNTAVGSSALNNNFTGGSNTAFGNQAGFGVSASNNTLIGYFAGQFSTGANNTAVGANALKANGASANSVAVGNNALISNTATSNTAIGYNALFSNATGTGNVAIGNQAGQSETTSNKLYITNSNTTATTSLIYGEFSPSRILRTNSTFQIGDPAVTGYVFPTARGTINQILQTDGVGVMSWVNPSSLSITETDPQVSSTITNNIPKWNGTTLIDGVITDDGTNVGIGTAPSAGNKLDIAGNTKTTNFQMTTGATANYFLQSNATGNATWVQNPLNTLSAVRTNLSADQALNNTGWQIVNFDTVVIDTNTEFASNRFTATKAGIYEINAGYHTDNQSNAQFYSIGVYVNGALYQITSQNHYNNGPVSRNINCIVNIAIGDYVEIFAENYQTPVDIDSFSGKTFFEVKQIR